MNAVKLVSGRPLLITFTLCVALLGLSELHPTTSGFGHFDLIMGATGGATRVSAGPPDTPTSTFVDSFRNMMRSHPCHDVGTLREEFRRVFAEERLVDSLGRIEPFDKITTFLAHFYSGTSHPLLIDIGANTGDVSERFVSFVCSRFAVSSSASPCGGRIFAYEPLASNMAMLEKQALQHNWQRAGFRAFRAALSSTGGGRNTSFFGSGVQGSLEKANSFAVEGEAELVPVFTLDEHLDSVGEGSAPILLLKIDTEGLDAEVLKGSARLLRERRATFIVFEYGLKLFPTTLNNTVQWLAEKLQGGLLCWLITQAHLIPLTGHFWSDEYECWSFSNVICAQADSPDAAILTGWWNARLRQPFGCV